MLDKTNGPSNPIPLILCCSWRSQKLHQEEFHKTRFEIDTKSISSVTHDGLIDWHRMTVPPLY